MHVKWCKVLFLLSVVYLIILLVFLISHSYMTLTKLNYHIYPKYSEMVTLYHTGPKILRNPFDYLLICFKNVG